MGSEHLIIYHLNKVPSDTARKVHLLLKTFLLCNRCHTKTYLQMTMIEAYEYLTMVKQ